MKSRQGGFFGVELRIVLIALLGLFGTSACLAADATISTWKLNEAKSTIAPGAPKNNTVVIAATGDQVKITVDGVSADGKPTYNEWTGKYDGKDYPVTGDPSTDARAYKKIDDRTVELTNKKGGKATTTGRIVISADGKTRSVSVSGTSADGKKVSINAVYDRQ